MYSSGHMTREEVEKQMRLFLTGGTPPLNPDGIRVSVHPRATGLRDRYWEIDESVAEYSPPGGWHYLLGAPPTITESCVIKHAPHYWISLGPGGRLLAPWGGPAVPYGS